MPIYEYACQACGRVTEVMQKLSDPAPTSCSSCHSGPMKKLMSRTAVVLKGGGWYGTDFKDGKASTGKPKTEPSDTPAAPSTPVGSKPADGTPAAEPAKPAADPAPASAPPKSS